MGTRNLTCIKKNGKYVLAKYCQWDGYYEGQGKIIADFLRKPGNIEKLRARADDLAFITDDELKAKWISVGANPDEDFVSWDVSELFGQKWPELHRNMGGDILDAICKSEGTFKTIDSLTFAADSLFCEFAYVIDFDENTFSWYEGFNHSPLNETERFHFLQTNDPPKDYRETPYYPVRMKGSVPLEPDKIPEKIPYEENED